MSRGLGAYDARQKAELAHRAAASGHRFDSGPTPPPLADAPEAELPAYPKATASLELRLRRVVDDHRARQTQLKEAMDRAIEAFADALEREDRRNATLSRLKKTANPKHIEEHNSRVLGRGRGIA